MVCIQCGEETHVINSRLQKKPNQIWRRRRCLNCGAIFTTEEAIDYSAAWRVKSPSGGLEPFLRDKLLLSLYKACGHRPTALRDATALTETLINKLRLEAVDGVINRSAIVQTAQVALNRFDKAAASYYVARH
jgi:transcriptional repressor NrdR